MTRFSFLGIMLFAGPLAMVSCILDRSGNSLAAGDSGVTSSGGGSASTTGIGGSGGGGAAGGANGGSGGEAGEGGHSGGHGGGGGAGGAHLLDCSSLELLACYGFDGDTMDQFGQYNFTGTKPVYFLKNGFTAFDVSESGEHKALGPALDKQQLTIELCFRAKTVPNKPSRVRLYGRSGSAAVYIGKQSTTAVPRVGFGAISERALDFFDNDNVIITADTWHHVAAVFDATRATDNIIVYVDGGSPTSHTTSVTIGAVDNNKDSTLGYPGVVLTQFDGYIDNLRVFHAARTSPEVAAAAANCPR